MCNNDLTASDDLKFKFATDGEGNYGYLGADDSFIPFSTGSSFEYVMGTPGCYSNQGWHTIYALEMWLDQLSLRLWSYSWNYSTTILDNEYLTVKKITGGTGVTPHKDCTLLTSSGSPEKHYAGESEFLVSTYGWIFLF